MSGDASESREQCPPELPGTHALDPEAQPGAKGVGPETLANDDPYSTLTEVPEGLGPERTSQHVVPQSLGALSPGMFLGEFELLRKIASGGMGTVWEARNTRNRLNLPVALKMLKAGVDATEADIQRFLVEARAVASLHSHPHIVKIYGIGAEGDLHYFAMQLIRGGSLDERLDSYRKDRRAAVRLLIQVASAIGHAHRRGILHRDLKPQNILLDDQGNPFVGDFGLAKRVDTGGAPSPTMAPPTLPKLARSPAHAAVHVAEQFNSNETEGGSILGTPSYMPPEQARGLHRQVSTLSDVYGLGAVFYEMLTGHPPFVGSGAYDIIARVISDPPRPPREVDPDVDRDLEAICLKCLAKTPADRYDSAESLIRDLQRWQERRPVHARSLPAWERAWMWARREPARAAAGVVAGLILGLIPVGWIIHKDLQIEKINGELQRKEAERQRVDKEAAEESYSESTRTIDKLVSTVESELSAEPSLQPLRAKLLQLAVDHFREAIEQWRDKPSHVHELAMAHGKKAEYANRLGGRGGNEARSDYEKAISLLKQGIDDNSQDEDERIPKWQADLASLHHDFGIFHAEKGDSPSSLEHYLEGLRLREMLCRCPKHDDPTCRECLDDDNRELRTQLGRSHGYLGDVYVDLGQDSDAERAYTTSHRIREDLYRKFANHADAKVADELEFQLARSFGNLALLARFHGELDKAIEHQERGSKLQSELIARAERGLEKDGGDHRLDEFLQDHANGLRDRGQYLIENERYREALGVLDQAKAQYERLLELKPGRTKLLAWLAMARAERAKASLALRDLDAAATELKAANTALERTRSILADDIEFRATQAQLSRLAGQVAFQIGKLDEAQRHFEAARALLDPLAVPDKAERGSFDNLSELGEAMADLGRLSLRQGKMAEAVSWLESALVRHKKANTMAPRVRLVKTRLARSQADLSTIQAPTTTSAASPSR